MKAARSLGKGAGSGIAAFRAEYPNFFHRGYVIHAGDHVQQLAHDVWSIPFSALWMIGDEIRPTRSAPSPTGWRGLGSASRCNEVQPRATLLNASGSRRPVSMAPTAFFGGLRSFSTSSRQHCMTSDWHRSCAKY